LTSSIGTQVQINESDLAFLRRVARRYDADLQVVGDELHVSARSDVQRGTVVLELYHQLKRAKFNADLAHQATRVTVAGWNPREGSAVSGESSGAHLQPGSGRTGASLLSDAVGDRVEHIAEALVSTDDEAQAFADAEFDRRARRFVTVSAVIDGNPLVRVGTNVDLRGISRRFNNIYYVVRARHRFDPIRGYETDFEAHGAHLGAA
jgi:phage protein D